MSDTRYIYITFGSGTPLRNRYVRVPVQAGKAGKADWEVARGLFGERYAATYTYQQFAGSNMAGRFAWTELKLTGEVLTALRGGELPPTDETNDTRAVREHMAQDLSTL